MLAQQAKGGYTRAILRLSGPHEPGEGAGPFNRLAHCAHHHLVWLLLGCYAFAALFPGPGL